ncbi:MAG: LysM peptidoglycan-binding domain-containing protein [Candidatus Cloacimonadota bacterium]|nr:LysM peptidoglycan-binding domain-containing protein [Candidatus Cloacimonadota bacterium]
MLHKLNQYGIKVLVLSIFLLALPIILCADVRYLTEDEYQDLSKDEVIKYWEELENEMMMLQARQERAETNITENENRIAEIKVRIAEIDEEYDLIYTGIMDELGGITHSQLVNFQKKLDEIRSQLDYYDEMPNTDLYANNDEIKTFINNYEQMKAENIAKAPKFISEFKELDRRFSKLDNALPQYYEDTHTVVRGEFLSKISSYKHIYNDPAKWGIIYRANRDQIKDPDLIYPDQIFKIPRGLPTSWKVYKGECLWTIASYPEVFNSPFEWPKIYRANKDKIKDPDLIYPNQILRIPRN